MTPTTEQFDAHYEAYLTWQSALALYWAMIEEVRRRQEVDPARREQVLRELDETHKVWMRAGEPLSYPRKA